ncbi:MAG TPA: PKD domain-containing protein [Cyclobacteriaceae bacterium]|nr:PKD domain-containing protein [Cyclobacteriaceae bacterium]
MSLRTLVLVLFMLLLMASLYGQSIDFDVQATACINERLELSSTIGAEEIEWNFCGNQLEGSYSSVYRGAIGNQLTNIKIVEDNDHWFGFALSRTNQLFQLDLGDNPANTPVSIISLGNPDNTIFSPEGIDIIKEGNTWYGLVTNQGNEITRLTWGTSLAGIPKGERLNIGQFNKLNVPIEIEILYDNNQYVAFVTNSSDNRLTLINFGNSISNTPTDSDVKMSSPFPGGSLMYGVASARLCDEWSLYTVASNKLYRVTLSSSLFDDIEPDQITDITSDVPIPIGEYNHVRTLIEGTDVHVFFSSYTGSQVQSVIWRAGASTAVFKDLQFPAFSYNPYGFDVYENEGAYGLFITGFDNGSFSQATVSSPCDVNQRFSNEINPDIFYTQSGTYEVILNVRYADGSVCASSESITVSNNMSPVISFTASNVKCVDTAIQFDSQGDVSEVDVFNWSFGDASTSIDPDPTHIYTNDGVFPVRLSVTGTNGCLNFSLDTMHIYNEPVALFTAPTGMVCTNNELEFENETVDEFEGNLSYEWLVNDVVESTARNFSTTFGTPGSFNVKLRTSIPGCTSQLEQLYPNVPEGPVVSFDLTGQCQDVAVDFTNTTTGLVSGYAWDFGDGQTSSQANPQNIYEEYGMYTVTLTASNAIGCNNKASRQVPIYSKPEVNFAAALPPFSCNGMPTQFNDLTPTPPDSNVDGWAWNFGDPGSSQNTSSIKNPQHTYANAGNYNVSLIVTTNFLCSSTVEMPVTISQTPTVNFSSAPTCEDVPVNFSGTSTATITSWNWTIGTTVYSTQNPTHTFINPGNSSAMLNVTATNGCIGSVTKPIVVPVKLTPDFSVARNCVNQQTTFTDITNATSDPLSSHQWSFGALGTANGSPVNFTFPTTGNVNVMLTNTTQTGCVYSISKLVNIIASPQASFTASPSAGAAPLNVQFTNTSVGATSYQWDFHDPNNTTSTAVSPAFVYQDLGEYQPELTAFNAQNCFHKASRTISVVIPVINVALNGLELIEFQSGLKPAVTIFNHGNTPTTNPSLLLNIAGQVIRERVSATINPNTSHRFVFSFEFPSSNSIDYFCVEAEVEDVTPADDEVCLSVEQAFITFPPYPNPTIGSFHLDWIAKEAGTVNIIVLNSMGQEQHNLQMQSVEGLNPIIITTDGLSAGIYFVKIKYQGFTRVYRVSVTE